MNGDFPIESALIFRLASLAKHLTLLDINIRLLFPLFLRLSGRKGNVLS